MSTGKSIIKFSNIKSLIPGNITILSMNNNLRNYNLNIPQSGKLSASQLKNSFAFPTINAPSSSYGRCYSVRKVISTYTGPVFQVRRSSDNVLQTFYSDSIQSYLTTGANNTGTTFANWVGANTAYVTVWYDQSTNANNASNAVNGNTQPNISLQNGKYVIQFQNANSTVLNIATPYSAYTVFCNFYNTNSDNGTIITTAGDFGLRFGAGAVNVNGYSNYGDWFFTQGGTKVSYNNGVPSTTVLLNGWNALTLSVGVASASPFNRIGMDGFSNTRAINGYMSEIILHNKAILESDTVAYYYSSLLNYIFPSLNAPSSSMLCCYSTRVVNPYYKGPILNLRRSSDNTLQDFYTDNIQSYLTTGANNTGIPFTTWIGTSTAYVYTWYDQSSNSNHATNTGNNTSQPNISFQNGKYVVQFQNGNGTVLYLISPIATSTLYTIFAIFYNTNNFYGTLFSTNGYWLSQRFGGIPGANGQSINGDNNGDDWYYCSGGTKLAYNNNAAASTILLNGWNILTLSVGTPANNASWNYLGADNYSSTRSMNGYIAEFICHNKSIVLNDINLYNNNSIFNAVFPTTNASSSSFMGCYSMRLIVPTYTGPILQLRRSSDNVLQTFYTDSIQSYLTTGANNTGTTFANWIGTGNTAYISIWYDQSTNARNASNTTNNTTQPNISLQNGKYVTQHITGNFTNLTMTTGIIPYTIFTHFYNTNTFMGTITGATSQDFQLRFYQSGGTLINGGSNYGDWYYSMSGTKIAYNNGSEATVVLLGGWNVLSLTGTTLSNPTTNFQMIGKDSFDGGKGITGYITEIIYINKTVTANDMVQYYNYRLF